MIMQKKALGLRYFKVIFIVSAIILIFTFLSFLTFYEVLSAGNVIPSDHCEGGDCCIQSNCSCPNCEGRGEPGDICADCGSDLCDNCGNCPDCGTSPCPVCRESCFECGSSDLCDTCNGCMECGHNRDPLCPECGGEPAPVAEPLDDPFDSEPALMNYSDGRINILLFAPFGTPAWAILSILVTIAGIVVTLQTVISTVRQKIAENKTLDRYISASSGADSYVLTQTLVVPDDYEVYNMRRRNGMLAAMYILSIAAALLILLLQDFNGVIVLFDRWVIVHSILFAGILICRKMIYRKNKKEGMIILCAD